MASEFSVPLPTPKSKNNNYAKRIHEIFSQHLNALENQRQTAIDTIDGWYHQMEQELRKRMNVQKDRINEHYNSIRPIFDEKYQENLDLATAYHKAQNGELFEELQDACRSLTIQVATLEFVKGELERPRVQIKEDVLEVKVLDINSKARRRRRRQMNDGIENTTTTNAGAQPSSPISSPKPVEYVFIDNVCLSLHSDVWFQRWTTIRREVQNEK